jgi:hypothetical protein
MRQTPALAVLLLAVLAGCGTLGGVGGPADGAPTPTLTPVAVPTGGSTPTPTAGPSTAEPAPVVLENGRAREYMVILSVVDGPVSVVEVFYRDGGTAVVDYAADPASLDARLAEGGVVGVRVPNRTGVARYRVAANASGTHRPFPALARAGAGTSVLWVAVPVAEAGVPTTVAAAGVDACAPPHSLVTEFRVRIEVGVERIRVDCA